MQFKIEDNVLSCFVLFDINNITYINYFICIIVLMSSVVLFIGERRPFQREINLKKNAKSERR